MSFLLIPLRALESWRDPPSTLVLAEWLTRMGQNLFNPPNVAGWPGGRNWLSTRTVIARANCMSALAAGTLNNPIHPPNLNELAARYPGDSDPAQTPAFVSRILFGRIVEDANQTADPASALLSLLTGGQNHLH